jgi:hypothetical protein
MAIFLFTLLYWLKLKISPKHWLKMPIRL